MVSRGFYREAAYKVASGAGNLANTQGLFIKDKKNLVI